MNRRGFVAAVLALPLVTRAARLFKGRRQSALRTDETLMVGVGGEFATIREALAVAGDGCIIYLLPGNHET